MPEYQTVNLLIVIIHRFTDSQFYIPFIPLMCIPSHVYWLAIAR